MADASSAEMAKAAISEAVRLIDFDSAELITGFINDTYFLAVSGTKPYINMEVRLVPMIYIQQPEYWRIEVVGFLPGYGLPAFAPYTADLDLSGFRGTKGIEVVGATRSEIIEIPPVSKIGNDEARDARNLGTWSAAMDLSGLVPQVIVDGEFPADEKPLFELIAKPSVEDSELNLELTFGYLVRADARSTKTVHAQFPAGAADQYKTVRVSDAHSRTIALMEVKLDPTA